MLQHRGGCLQHRVSPGTRLYQKHWRQQVVCEAKKAPDANTPVELSDSVIWLRGIAWAMPFEAVEACLHNLHPPSCVLVPKAKTKHGQHGHKGFAFIAFDSQQAAQEARVSLEALPLGGLDANEDQQLQARRQKLKRQRARRLEQRVEKLESILSAIPPPGGLSALTAQPINLYCPSLSQQSHEGHVHVQGARSSAALATPPTVDWAAMPAACQVTVASHGGDWAALSSSDVDESSDSEVLDSDMKQLPLRVLRKRAQVESFAEALRMLLNLNGRGVDHEHQQVVGATSESHPVWRAHVVEFGSGSGNLVLPLAWSFPDCHFHAVDYKLQSVLRLQQRAAEAGLTNLTASVGLIQEYKGPLDVALALHACGSATDYAMLQAAAVRAAYIISPCCIGKLRLPAGDPARSEIERLLTHPRSRWLASYLPGPQVFDAYQVLAQAADVSHGESHSHVGLARLAKHHVELDRNVSMEEMGYQTLLTKLLRPQLHQFKSDLLVGAPKEHVGSKFGWRQSMV